MRKYVAKRLGISVIILLFVIFIIYVLMRCMPASYVETMAIQLSQAPGSKPYEEWVAQLNAQYGLDVNIVKGYFIQLKNIFTFTPMPNRKTAGSTPSPFWTSSTTLFGCPSSSVRLHWFLS